MLVYSATKHQFIDDVRANAIAESIENEVARLPIAALTLS